MRIEINPAHPEPRKIARAVEALAAGRVIAYPTDTVYALGCDLLSKRAIEALYAVKQMPREQPLALMAPDLSEVARYAVVQDFHYRFIKHLIPGPYTFVLDATREVPKLVMMKRRTVGIRVPDHPVSRELARALGRPIMTTSAVAPGRPGVPLQDPDEVDDVFPRLELVLDAGPGGVETSTVVDLTGRAPEIVREGAGMDKLVEVFGFRRSFNPDDLEL
jgi:tRNA threonylcarbamoyl adenosine modification protein (Sua5/YciO/YrdC/YwlC family)